MNDSIYAQYRIETPFDLEYAAEVLAGEQSTGTFISVPGETEYIKEMHRAQVVEIKELEFSNNPSLPGAKSPNVKEGSIYKRAEVTVKFPFHNIGASIPNLMATVAGNLYELREFSGLKLIDLDLPDAFSEKYKGPKFGIDGTRKLTDVYNRPIIGTIVKPSIGLSSDELRVLIRDLAMSGIDFIKDDEVNGNPPYFPLRERVKVVMEEIERAADITGKKTMYAFNITDDIENLVKNYELVQKSNGNCVMVSINSIGFAGVTFLRDHAELPIHGHRNQWGAMTRHPLLGMEFRVYQKLCRLAGVDHLHTNGLHNKFFETDESVIQSVLDCLTPMYDGYSIMPVLSSGQWAAQAVDSYRTMKTYDVIHLAGGGIMAHPGGPSAGFISMQQGWEAAMRGVDLVEYANDHVELKQAIDKYSK